MIILCWCSQWAKVDPANTALHWLASVLLQDKGSGPEPVSFDILTFPPGKMVWETSGSERHWIFLNFFLWGPAPLLPFAACSCCQEMEDRGVEGTGFIRHNLTARPVRWIAKPLHSWLSPLPNSSPILGWENPHFQVPWALPVLANIV